MTSGRNGGGSDAPGAMMAEDYDDRYEYRASDLDDEEIERRLIEDVKDDERLQSGAGRRCVDSEVDFVKMSGLTQPDPENAPWPDAEAEPELPEDADPNAPISFFEEGVDDVDAASDPITAHDRPLPNGDELVSLARDPVTPERPEPTFLRDLKSIVSDYSTGNTADEPIEATPQGEPDENAADIQDEPRLGFPADEETAPEWTRQLDQAEEHSGDSGWGRPAYEDLDADMLEWIAEKLETDDAGETAQWEMSGRQYSLETQEDVDDIAPTPARHDDAITHEDIPPVTSLPDVAPPSRPMPPWAAFRRPLGDDELAEDTAAADYSLRNDASPPESYYDPNVWEPEETQAKGHAAPGEAVGRPAHLGEDVEEERTTIPLPAPSLRTRELTRAQALMHTLDPAPVEAEEEVTPEPVTTAEELGEKILTSSDVDPPTQIDTSPLPPFAEPDDGAATDEDGLDGGFTPRRRTRQRRRSWLNVILRMFFTVITIATLGAAATAGWWWYQRQAESPEGAYQRAENRLNAGEYTAASADFLRFTETFPQSPLKADALFHAAYALQAVPANPKPAAESAYVRSLGLFDRFVEQYPGHEKTPRAQTMAAVLEYRLGRYDQAIARLQSTDGRTADPLTYLPSLRTLARSYAQLGELDEARSAFLRAASLDTNYAPDQDYLELAALFKTFAAEAETEAERDAYVAQAIEMWNYALRVPGLPAPKRRAIKNYIAAEEQLLNEGPAPMSTAQTTPDVR